MVDIPDEKEDLVVFLRTHVDPNNLSVPFETGDPATPNDTSGDIQFADYDSGLDFPGIYVQAEETTVPGGGITGFTGMDAGGGGPTQDPVTTIQVDCWGGSKQTDRLQNAGVDPDSFAKELANEVWNVCIENAQGPTGYRFISVANPSEANDTEVDPTRYRRIVPVAMGYHIHPTS